MKLIKNVRWRMLARIVISLLLVLVLTGAAFINQSSFGRLAAFTHNFVLFR